MIKTKILICGAMGFIGRNIVEEFSKREDFEIFATYYNINPDKFLLNNKNISWIRADLTKKDDVEEAIKNKDIVIQAAAVTSGSKDILAKPYIHVTDNAVMNSLIFRSAFENRVKHVIFFSCTVMYPNQKNSVKEEDFDYKITDKYFGIGWTKVYIEKMCEFYSKISKTKYTAIRHANIYGPFDKYDLERSHFFGATITKILTSKGNKINVWGDGSEKRDLLYVSDLIDFVEIIIKKQKQPFELVNLGLGKGYSIKELTEKIIKISGKKLSIEFDTSKPTIKFNLAVNINKAQERYSWKPKVSLEEGIRKTVNWYKKNML